MPQLGRVLVGGGKHRLARFAAGIGHLDGRSFRTGATVPRSEFGHNALELGGGQLGQNGPKGEGSTLIPRARTTLALEENERWFLVHTQPSSERKAELHLGAQGFRAFLPQIQKTIRHARQLRTVQAPLFPRYMFLILDLGRDRWLSVRSTVGVSSLFTCDDRPVPVPSGVVEAFIARTNEAGLALFDAGLRTGQTVRILSGPFADFVGTLERLDAAGRVRVLLTMMGTAVPVTLHRSALLPAA